ncbi:MAG: hypothetical protein ACREJ2_04790 [Planctomycetota bacterium]
MSQFCLVFTGRFEGYDEPVAAALSAAFGQGMEWGRPVVASAPIVLVEGLTEQQAQAIHAALRPVETAGCRLGVHSIGAQEIEGFSKLRWPTPPTINGRPLEAYNAAGPAVPMVQIACPHCGNSFRVALNIIAGTQPSSPRASNRQLSPTMGSPTGNSLTSSGNYAALAPAAAFAPPAQPGPQTYGVAGVGTSSGFYQLPGSSAMIGPSAPAQAQASSSSQAFSGPTTPTPPNAGVALPKARSVTPNPAQMPQPMFGNRPSTPDRGQRRPSPPGGQRHLSPPAGQPQSSTRPQSSTPGAGASPMRPHSGHFAKPDTTPRAPIELPPARPLPSAGPRPGSHTNIPTLPPSSGAATPGGSPNTPNVPSAPSGLSQPRNLPSLAPLSDNSELQGPMSLDEFEAHVSGIHAPIESPPPEKKNTPPSPNRRRSDRRSRG